MGVVLINEHHRRKLSDPHRSATALDNFLSPGVVFRFPSRREVELMDAAYVSATARSPPGTCFANIHAPEPISDLGFSERKSSDMSPFSLDDAILQDEPFHRSEAAVPMTRPSMALLQTHLETGKHCFSCGAKRTPYWREGWSSHVTLCNACGIRFHKYHRYCERCLCIARKDEHGRLHCPSCRRKL